MAALKLKKEVNLIVACCENNGIGINGKLPWSLRGDMQHFTKMTKRTATSAESEIQNAVIMGRNTFESIPSSFRPLKGRINFLVSTKAASDPDRETKYKQCVVSSSFEEALVKADKNELVESIWVIGGASIYEIALKLNLVDRIYLTKVFNSVQCDTFMPPIDFNQFDLVKDPDVPEAIQEEKETKYQYEIYEKKSS